MPNTYGYSNSGEVLRTRYSELVGCTERGVVSVARKILSGTKSPSSGITAFGSVRHDMFCQESTKTGKLPECFRKALNLDWDALMCEEQISNVVFPMVELYSTLDAYCPSEKRIIDYKTASVDPKRLAEEGQAYFTKVRSKYEMQYKRSKQHLCYALQLSIRGEIPGHATYLIEYWNSDRDKATDCHCYGYQRVDVDISLQDIQNFRSGWLKERCERLMIAIDMLKSKN
jgi:hypothetical protein|nr:MAG TPA: protein of unknown function DUF3799 [Caudoviricetes sp.]